jgi:hypothetical protein
MRLMLVLLVFICVGGIAVLVALDGYRPGRAVEVEKPLTPSFPGQTPQALPAKALTGDA